MINLGNKSRMHNVVTGQPEYISWSQTQIYHQSNMIWVNLSSFRSIKWKVSWSPSTLLDLEMHGWCSVDHRVQHCVIIVLLWSTYSDILNQIVLLVIQDIIYFLFSSHIYCKGDKKHETWILDRLSGVILWFIVRCQVFSVDNSANAKIW